MKVFYKISGLDLLVKTENNEKLFKVIGFDWGYPTKMMNGYIKVSCYSKKDMDILIGIFKDCDYELEQSETIENLIKVEYEEKYKSTVILTVEDESFVDEIVGDLINNLRISTNTNQNIIKIKLKNFQGDLMRDLINTVVDNFNNNTYKCKCGNFEYIEEFTTCALRDEVICRDCAFESIDGKLYCRDCANELNKEDLEDLI